MNSTFLKHIALTSIFALGSLNVYAGTVSTPAYDATQFFSTSRFSNAELSPDGSRVAMQMKATGDHSELIVMDIATRKARRVAAFNDADVVNAHWINDKRLVFSAGDLTRSGAADYAGAGLYAVDDDGGRNMLLIRRNVHKGVSKATSFSALPAGATLYALPSRKDQDYIFVRLQHYDPTIRSYRVDGLARLDTVTGKLTTIESPAGANAWVIDAQDVVRVAIARNLTQAELYSRTQDTENWGQATKIALPIGESFSVKFLSSEGQLYVTSRHQGDFAALYTFDLKTGSLSEKPLAQLADFDLDGTAITARGKLLGIRYQGETLGTAWFDPALQALQTEIDTAHPDTINLLRVASEGDSPYVLVTELSDVQAPRFELYHRSTHEWIHLGDSHPGLQPEDMAHSAMIRYRARDGMMIPAYLTLPRHSPGKNLPLVVLVHGGPFLRSDSWEWSPEVQYLASRGYAVLRPQFRGTDGFGLKHLKAGFKQWGQAMQDDLADATQWAIEQGYADASRICIAGGSYGGYATFMGLAQHPELYRCGVEIAGVTDLMLFVTQTDNDISTAARQLILTKTVGDPTTEADKLKQYSPVNLAGSIKQPILMAHGDNDVRVTLEHGTSMLNALRKTNDKVEWLQYSSEGHGLYQARHLLDYWEHVGAFLDRNLTSQPATRTN